MPLVVGFAAALGAVVLLTAAVTGASFSDVVSGKAGQVYKTNVAAHSSTGTSAAPASSASSSSTAGSGVVSGTASQILKQIPPGTFASSVTIAGIQPRVLEAVLYAKMHGWTGTVISGFRTLAQQTSIYDSGVRPAALPGTSNHEKGLAIDINPADVASFAAIMANAPASIRLISGASYGDPGHFSPDGH